MSDVPFRYIIITDVDSGKPFVRQMKFKETSPKGLMHRYVPLDSQSGKPYSYRHNELPPETIKEAIYKYQLAQISWVVIFSSRSDIDELSKRSIQRIVDAEKLQLEKE